MDRRAFLRDATRMLLVMPFGAFLVQCSDDDDGGPAISVEPTVPPPVDTTPPDAPPRVEGANVVYTSSETNAHSHSFSIPSSAFASPPLAGLSGATTEAQLHTHLLAVTQADLMNAAAGQSVKVVTTSDAGHTHTFTIVRVA